MQRLGIDLVPVLVGAIVDMAHGDMDGRGMGKDVEGADER